MSQNQQAYPVPASTGSSGSSTPRFLPIRDVVSILADSASGHYTRHPLLPSCIRLEGRPLGTIADAIANPPTTWTQGNSGRATSASASGDSLTVSISDATTDGYYYGTGTAWNLSRAVTAGTGRLGMIIHIAGTTLSGTSTGVRIGITHGSAQWLACADLFNSAGTIYARYIVNNTSFNNVLSMSSGQASTGMWVWIEVDTITSYVWVRYSLASFASGEPTSWSILYHGSTTATYPDDALAIVLTAVREAANTPPVAVFSGLRTYSSQEGHRLVAGSQNLDFTGYASAGDAMVVGDFDFGTDGALPDLATLRLMCADAVNRLPGDAATWTWSMTGSASSAPAAATTYQSAASLTLKQPSSDTAESTARRYWRLRVKAASSGSTQAGSLDLSRIPGVYVAAAA